jgi:hypothetical protein
MIRKATLLSKRRSISRVGHKKREAKINLKDDCPFKLKSYLLSSGCWSLNIVNDEHNHDVTQNFQGHKYAASSGREGTSPRIDR